MERRRRHLIPLLLLLGLLAGAAAIIGADAQPCESTYLATRTALFCASGLPTAPCCEQIVAIVDLGGGVPCLCRVAAQPQVIFVRLNASHLVSLYIACGGRLYADDPHFAATVAACLGSPPLFIYAIDLPLVVPLRDQQFGTAPPNTTVITPPEVPLHKQRPLPSVVAIMPVHQAEELPLHTQRQTTTCDWTLLAFELTHNCHDDMGVPNTLCCRNVLMTIDNQDPECLCRVVEAGDLVVSGFLDVWVMWDLYRECGGRKQAIPKDQENCAHAPSPSPPPPPPPPLAPPPPVPKTRHPLPVWEIVVIVVGVVVVVAAASLMAVWIRNKVKATEAKERKLSLSSRDQEEINSRELESEEDQSSHSNRNEELVSEKNLSWKNINLPSVIVINKDLNLKKFSLSPRVLKH